MLCQQCFEERYGWWQWCPVCKRIGGSQLAGDEPEAVEIAVDAIHISDNDEYPRSTHDQAQ